MAMLVSSADTLFSAVPPDKIAWFLYEYHDSLYSSSGLPCIPLDRSNASIHCILLSQQVPDTGLQNTEHVHVMHIVHILHIYIYATTYIKRHIVHILHF
jgi:hypothetical protein